jgi:hypothetical protein
MVLVDVPRIAARVIAVDPQIVIARHECLEAREIPELFQTIVKKFIRADVAAEKEQIGGLIAQVLKQEAGGIVAGAIVSPVQIGSDGDAHEDIIRRAIRCDAGDGAGMPTKKARTMRNMRIGLARGGETKGPPTIPSLPNGPEVLFFSPKVEDTPE